MYSLLMSASSPRWLSPLVLMLVLVFAATALSGPADAKRKRKSKKAKAKPTKMVKVPAGTYTVRKPGSDTATATQQVVLKSFSMDRHEVTVAEYRRCVLSAKCSEPLTGTYFSLAQRRIDFKEFCNWGQQGRDDHPVNCVSRKQATEYCAVQGKRLPTSAEWEAGNYGDTSAKRRLKFAFGAELTAETELCWNRKDLRKGTCATDLPSADVTWRGIAGLASNVTEWTSTDACPGAEANCRNPLAVIRGGNWYNAFAVKAGVARMRLIESKGYDHILGFRCVSK